MRAYPAIECPVVAIGASAGGLKALEDLFDTMPVDTGMACVIVTHMEPTHKSHLAELPARHTIMPVAANSKSCYLKPFLRYGCRLPRKT